MEEIQIRIAETENQIRQLCRNEAELEQKIEELEQKNQERVTQIQSLKEQKAGLSQTVSLQQTQLVTNATLAEEKDKHIQDISRRNAELRQQNEELEQKNEEQVTQIQSLKEQKTGLSQTVSLQQTQLEANATLAEEKDKHIQDISRRNAELKQQNEEQSTHIQLFEDTEIGDGSGELAVGLYCCCFERSLFVFVVFDFTHNYLTTACSVDGYAVNLHYLYCFNICTFYVH